MVSRQTKVQIAIAVLAFSAFVVLSVGIGFTASSALNVVLSGMITFLLLGGTHLYFALRGEEEGVPVASRWRTVGLIGAYAALPVVAYILMSLTPLSGRAITIVVAVPFLSVLAVYWYREAREGYRESRAQGET